MNDETEILLKFCEEQWKQARHVEDQRAAVSNLIIITSSVIIGLVSQQGLSERMLPMTILLIVLGLFGAIITEKLHELFYYHHDKAQAWQNRINELNPNARINETEKIAMESHSTLFRSLRQIRLYQLWKFLQIAVALIGTTLTLLILF